MTNYGTVGHIAITAPDPRVILPLSEEAHEPTQKHQGTPTPVGSVDRNHVYACRVRQSDCEWWCVLISVLWVIRSMAAVRWRLPDTTGGVATLINLPADVKGTTTIESKTNFVSAAKEGSTVIATATPVHRGRRTQVWQTRLETEEGRLVALVTQTQLIL